MYKCNYCGAYLDPGEKCDCEAGDNYNSRNNSSFTTYQLVSYQIETERRKMLEQARNKGLKSAI